MSFRRRFVYLVMNDTKRREEFPLSRMDEARFFFRKDERPQTPPPEDTHLPPPSINHHWHQQRRHGQKRRERRWQFMHGQWQTQICSVALWEPFSAASKNCQKLK